jgi:hypothetical protein
MLPIAFAAPLALYGLIALPAIWWLLRVSPPPPLVERFPPLMLIAGIRRREATPASSPWWLLALRLVIAALLVFAAAGPDFRPTALPTLAPGPVWIIVDNGYAAAPDWQARITTVDTLLADASLADRPVLIAATADGPARDFGLTDAGEGRRRLKALTPRSYLPARDEILAPLGKAAAAARPGTILVVAAPAGDGSFATFAGALKALAPEASLIVAGSEAPAPAVIAALGQDGAGITVDLRRASPASTATGMLRLLDRRGRVVDETPYAFPDATLQATIRLDLPLELRNDVARAEIAGLVSAGAVRLTDDGWRRRSVGIVSTEGYDEAQPLLSPRYFLEKALAPFADIRPPRQRDTAAALAGFIDDGVAAIVLADVGRLPPEAEDGADRFLKRGGVLIRFAGPRFAAASDSLVPVTLRHGDRVLGGALSWDKPRALDPFPADGPYAGLAVPKDVSVSRQVLAEPSVDLAAHTWAQLSDGTPLITARRVGDGWLVLFHVTADTRWSNLTISGAFVEIMRRTVALGRTAAEAPRQAMPGTAPKPPLSLLDGWGRPAAAPAEARGLAIGGSGVVRASRTTPAGLYGDEDSSSAVNAFSADLPYVTTGTAVAGATKMALAGDHGTTLRPYLFLAALLLLVADAFVVVVLAGRLSVAASAARLGMVLLVTGLVTGGTIRPASATDDAKVLAALATTRLAYVETGDAGVDATSAAGLSALSDYLSAHSSLEPGAPLAVDPARDDLSVLGLLYWPIVADRPAPGREAIARTEAFMRTGGTVLFDTRDEISVGADGLSPERDRLADMLAGLDLPPLEPVPATHVLTKSFYLLSDFPGRYAGSPLWVEAAGDSGEDADRPVRRGDGVSSILITGNDLAGAWATDAGGAFLNPLVPGTPDQRAHAFRAGVNIVMYVLTGNYKADQVHVPALIERLGR